MSAVFDPAAAFEHSRSPGAELKVYVQLMASKQGCIAHAVVVDTATTKVPKLYATSIMQPLGTRMDCC